MNTVYRLLLVVAILPAAPWLLAHDAETSVESGHVLLLENDRMIEGDIVRDGERYRIRRSLGETWVPANKAVHLCASREDAYQFLRGRANLRDVDERLRLARWCHWHGLREQGSIEAQAALALKPGNADAQRLLQALRRPSMVGTTAAASKKEPEPIPIPAVDLTLEATGQFASRVQPILMNKCASCHAANRGGSFNLVRTFADGSLNQRATLQNRAAVVAQINLENWQASPLLVKSVGVHGEANKAPLKNRQEPAYQMLEEWVQLAVSNVPARSAASAPVFLPAQAPAARTFAEAVPQPKSEIVPVSVQAEAKANGKDTEPKATATAGQTKLLPETPQKLEAKGDATDKPAAAADPFDPVLFNQQKRP